MRVESQSRARNLWRGVSLIELLVVMAIVAILAALSVGLYRKSVESAKISQCASKMRALGSAILAYTADHDGEFPRSWHSAGAHRQPGWAFSVAPYLGYAENEVESNWPSIVQKHYRCPSDPRTDPYMFSYAMNVFFELDPNGDDYEGAPASWRKVFMVPRPSQTVLLAEAKSAMFGDHFMAHQWSSAQAAMNALNFDIHQGKSNVLFVDGHVRLLTIDQVFSSRQNNLFHPGATP